RATIATVSPRGATLRLTIACISNWSTSSLRPAGSFHRPATRSSFSTRKRRLRRTAGAKPLRTISRPGFSFGSAPSGSPACTGTTPMFCRMGSFGADDGRLLIGIAVTAAAVCPATASRTLAKIVEAILDLLDVVIRAVKRDPTLDLFHRRLDVHGAAPDAVD